MKKAEGKAVASRGMGKGDCSRGRQVQGAPGWAVRTLRGRTESRGSWPQAPPLALPEDLFEMSNVAWL